MVGILARLPEVLEAGMRRRIGNDMGSQLFGHQPGQPFGEPHPDAADALRPEANRGGQHQIGAIRLQQVDRADVGLEPLPDQMHDVGQRFGGVAALEISRPISSSVQSSDPS